jgi:hypothetical protein
MVVVVVVAVVVAVVAAAAAVVVVCSLASYNISSRFSSVQRHGLNIGRIRARFLSGERFFHSPRSPK